MAKQDYPRIPAKNWWQLRKRFKQSMPPSISINYLASLLEISERAAMNIMPHFKTVKLIDEDGKTNDRTNSWRDDEEYSKVCNQIKNETYSEELLSLAPDPVEGFDSSIRWFMRETGVGEAAAKQMARFYQIVAKADPSEGEEVLKAPSAKGAKKTKAKTKVDKDEQLEKKLETKTNRGKSGAKQFNFQPSININIQIHISPDASTQQIDQIFSSIANHFKEITVSND